MEWIDVEKSLPFICQDVILFTSSGFVSTGHLSHRGKREWTIHNEELKNDVVLFWMNLPKEPKIDEKQIDNFIFNMERNIKKLKELKNGR